jgi:hypothetical protein
MPEAPTFERVLWGVTFLLNTGLVALLVYRKNYRVFPFFFLYLLLNLLEAFVLFGAYQAWGFFSRKAMQIAWSAQGLVSLARAVAVAEICYLVLAKFRGVWRLAWRLLAAAAAVLVALYTAATARGRWHFAMVNLDRGLELLIATVVVMLFVFVRYYEVDVQSSIRTLAIGFFLYSDFRVLNDSILERLWRTYTPLWNRLGTLTFLVSLLLWSWALSHKLEQTALEPALLPEEHYHSLSPAINTRLKNLNERLDHFWDAQRQKT